MKIYFFYFFISCYYFVICLKKDTIRVKVVLIATSFPSKTSTRTFQKILKSAIELHVVKPEKLGKLKPLICHDILRYFGWNQLPGKKIIFLSDVIKKNLLGTFRLQPDNFWVVKEKLVLCSMEKPIVLSKQCLGTVRIVYLNSKFTFMVNTYLHFKEWWSYLDNI